MPYELNKHIPEMGGGRETVPSSGTLVVDTLLRTLQSVSVSLAQDSVATAASVSYELVAQVAGQTQKITVKTWAADGFTAGSTAADVDIQAIGN